MHAVIQKIHTYIHTKMNLEHSEMGPVRRNLIQRPVRSVHMCALHCAQLLHTITQNRPDNFPSSPPDNHHCSDDVYLRERGGGDVVHKTGSTIHSCQRRTEPQTHVTCTENFVHFGRVISETCKRTCGQKLGTERVQACTR